MKSTQSSNFALLFALLGASAKALVLFGLPSGSNQHLACSSSEMFFISPILPQALMRKKWFLKEQREWEYNLVFF